MVNLFRSVSPAPQCVQKDHPEDNMSKGTVKTGEGKGKRKKEKDQS
jgi:hypothetical protein